MEKNLIMAALFTPSQVEEQLRLLQRELSPAEARSSLFNLVIFARAGERTPVEPALKYLLGKRAARIIHIVHTTERESSMSVTARCYPDRENRGVCFQEIVIQNGRDDAGSAVGTWAPLLVRDIPAFVLWYDRIVENRSYLVSIRDIADKIIIDSDWLEGVGEHPDETFDIMSGDFIHTGSLVSDLTWRRTLSLRLITAFLFDTAETIPKLDLLTRVEIGGTTAAVAELYFLWLASRLEWSWEGRFTFREGFWTAREPGGRDVLLSRMGANGQPESGIHVRFHTAEDEIMELRAQPGGPAEVTVPGKGGTRYHYRLPDEGEMLLEEVDALRSDFLFAEAMRLLR